MFIVPAFDGSDGTLANAAQPLAAHLLAVAPMAGGA